MLKDKSLLLKMGKVSQETQGFRLGVGKEMVRPIFFVVPYIPPRPKDSKD